MYTAVTRDIQVTVLPAFSAERSEPAQGQYFWTYTIEISNRGAATVQIVGRYWKITDARGSVHEVRGQGVVGEQPILQSGETFRYTSGCPLATASGIMEGRYRVVAEDGESFEIAIPAFSLDSPHGKRVLN